RCNRRAVALVQAVVDPHGMAVTEQLLDEHAADVARAARDQHAHASASHPAAPGGDAPDHGHRSKGANEWTSRSLRPRPSPRASLGAPCPPAVTSTLPGRRREKKAPS